MTPNPPLRSSPEGVASVRPPARGTPFSVHPVSDGRTAHITPHRPLISLAQLDPDLSVEGGSARAGVLGV